MTAAAIASALGNAQPDGKGYYRCNCPHCAGHNLVLCDGDHQLLVTCWNGCDRKDVLAELRSRGLYGTGRKANEHDGNLPETPTQRQARTTTAAGKPKNKTAEALQIWNDAEPTSGTMADTYLGSRQLLLEIPDTLRLARNVYRPKSHDMRPHLIGRVEHETNGPVGIHLIALNPLDATARVSGKDRKWSKGPVGGGAVRLFPAGPILAIAEGVEDALTYTQERTVPAWAVISATGMKNFVPPPLTVTQTVILIEDQDDNQTGQRAVADTARRLAGLGYKVKICRPKIGKDINEALALLGTGEELFDHVDYDAGTTSSGEGNGAEPPPEWEEQHPPQTDASDGAVVPGKADLPPHYIRAKGGIWFQPPDEGGTAPDRVWICADLQFEAETSDETNNAHGLLLRFIDRADKPHEWAMPRRMVHSEGNVIAAALEDAGLSCGTSRKAHDHLRHLLGAIRVDRRVRCVDRAGWHGNTFVLPDGQAFGADAAAVVMQSEQIATGSLYAARGTLDGWCEQVACHAVGNDLLAFSISSAFAAPLLDLTGESSGGTHIDGVSRSGKTTLLCAAASVWGPGEPGTQIRSWRLTANGLEAVAAETSDGLLLLDEIGQANAREVQDVIYMLANQAGKARANRAGGARRHKTWRVLYLSTGEVTPAAKMAEGGVAVRAGLDVRLVTLCGDAGAGLGVFNDLHSMPSAAAMADHLRDASRTCCGTAGPAFLEAVARDRVQDAERLTASIRELRERFFAEHLPTDADGQVRSVASRFALTSAAGELAQKYGIVPWPEGEAIRAVAACFNRWLAARGGTGAAENMQAVDAVRRFIAAHGSSRFEDTSSKLDGHDLRISNRAGFKRRNDAGDWEYLILTDPWRDEVCAGLNPKRVARVLAGRQLLLGWTARSMAASVRVPGHERVRVYCVSGTILEGEPADGE
jgi:uncharacterized protein (DUF927 family)